MIGPLVRGPMTACRFVVHNVVISSASADDKTRYTIQCRQERSRWKSGPFPGAVVSPRPRCSRFPPQSIEAEQSVLGGLLLDNVSFDRIADQLGADDFYRREHRLIFSAIAGLCQESSPADVVTVAEYLEKRADLENARRACLPWHARQQHPSTANIVAYAAIVRERAILRRLIHVSGEIAPRPITSKAAAPRTYSTRPRNASSKSAKSATAAAPSSRSMRYCPRPWTASTSCSARNRRSPACPPALPTLTT